MVDVAINAVAREIRPDQLVFLGRGKEKQMRAAVLTKFGQAPTFAGFQQPHAEAGEILVKVTSNAIKQLDRDIAAGTHYGRPKHLAVICGNHGAARTLMGS